MKKMNDEQLEVIRDLFNSKLPTRESLKRKKQLTVKELEFIYMVYESILSGQATRTDITKAYYHLTQDNVQESFRMTTIINWVEKNYQDEYNKAVARDEKN
jgi:hypothetical protein